MRVEAESTSSHGAAIVAFEASGLARAVLSSNENGCNGFHVMGKKVMRLEYRRIGGNKKGNKKGNKGNKMRLEYREGTKISKDL